MIENEAYEDTYPKRVLTRYNVGDIVEIGPAYRIGGSYYYDGSEGIYTVLGELASPYGAPDYYLARGEISNPNKNDWELIVHPSRLSLVRSA